MTELLEIAILKSSQINVASIPETTTDMPVLPITSTTLTLIELCWSNRVNLPPLMARFWKLCCQVSSSCMRYNLLIVIMLK
jgi:hypothetical protein